MGAVEEWEGSRVEPEGVRDGDGGIDYSEQWGSDLGNFEVGHLDIKRRIYNKMRSLTVIRLV